MHCLTPNTLWHLCRIPFRFKWSIGYGQSHQEMGNVPRSKPILLWRPAHDGTACSSFLHQCDPHHWHECTLLCIRVSRVDTILYTIITNVCDVTNYHLHFFVSCPYLSRRVTPVIPVISGVLFLFVIGSLFKTSFTDPGIIPRATDDEAAYIEKQVCKYSTVYQVW